MKRGAGDARNAAMALLAMGAPSRHASRGLPMTSCNRCGAGLEPGSLKYLITVSVAADFDGMPPTEVEMEDLEAFMRQVDRGGPTPADNDKDVYLSQGYVLCPACKAAFLADPLGTRAPGDGPVPSPDNETEGGKVH